MRQGYQVISYSGLRFKWSFFKRSQACQNASCALVGSDEAIKKTKTKTGAYSMVTQTLLERTYKPHYDY